MIIVPSMKSNPRSNALTRHPLVGIAVMFAAGNAAGLTTGHWTFVAWVWIGTALGWLAAQRIRKIERFQSFALLLVVLASGWLSAAITADRRSSALLELEQYAAARTVTIRGTVSGNVEISKPDQEARTCRFALRDVVVCDPVAGDRPNITPVQVTWAILHPEANDPRPATGEQWSLTGRMVVRSGMLRKAHAMLSTRASRAQKLAPASLRDIQTLADCSRQWMARRLSLGIEGWGATPALVQAIFLGIRHDIPHDLLHSFRDSGIMYAFAIAGLHVAIVTTFVIGFLSLLGVARHWWCVPLAPMILFYTAATGMSASALRASLMAILFFGAPLIGRRSDKLSTLAAAAIIALGISPVQLLDAGFCLSFAVMSGLFLFYPSLAGVFKRALRVDQAMLEARASSIPNELSPMKQRGIRWRARALRWFAETMAVSITAWLFSTPLTAYYFGQITPGSLLASLIVAPTLFGVGMASCAGLIAGFFSPWMEIVFNHAAGILAQIMARAACLAAEGGSIVIHRPTPWVITGWYVILLLLTWGLWRITHPRASGSAWLISRRKDEA